MGAAITTSDADTADLDDSSSQADYIVQAARMVLGFIVRPSTMHQ